MKKYMEYCEIIQCCANLNVSFGTDSYGNSIPLRGENGKELFFGSCIDVANYLSKNYGWYLIQIYHIECEVHWIMGKEKCVEN